MEMETRVLHREPSDGASLARGLGWFSVGLGLAEMAAPRAIAKLIGVESKDMATGTLRMLGAREIASGFGILTRPRRAGPVWSRVVGDVIDIALLAWAMRAKRTNTERVAAALASVLGVTALDVYASRRLQRTYRRELKPVVREVTINRPTSEVYAQWRKFQEFPTFMKYVESVTDLGGGRWHWVTRLPTGQRVEWDAELVEDLKNEVIAWRAIKGVNVQGFVAFDHAPGGRGTEVRVEMRLGGGRLGAALAKLFAAPEVASDLRRFKQVMETGEVVHSDASIHRGMHPAQPSRGAPR
jgi:uncharacterized membrane protein